MKQFLSDHFVELLLTGITVFFAMMAFWLYKHGGDSGDAFKAFIGFAGSALAALIMKLNPNKAPEAPKQ